MERNPDKYWNPYLAGIALGLVLACAYLFVGKGLGASGPALRIDTAVLDVVAPSHVAHIPGLAKLTADGHPLDFYLLFVMLGTFLGGFVAAYTSGRLKRDVVRGATASSGLRQHENFIRQDLCNQGESPSLFLRCEVGAHRH